MFYFKFFILLMLSFSVFADAGEQSPQIYTKSSKDRINQLNNAVKILRDPTKMSVNFRQALKNITPKDSPIINKTPSKKLLALPNIELAGKVLTNSKKAKAMLRVNKQIYYVFTGSTISLVNNNQVITLKIHEVTKNHVKINVLPQNQILFLQ